MTGEQIDATPIPGTWTTRQVICHIADFEPVYADRMKRALAEDQPTVFGGDPDAFAARPKRGPCGANHSSQPVRNAKVQKVKSSVVMTARL